MSNKEVVIELVKRLPPDVSLRDIAEEIEFMAAIQEGFDQIEQGKGIPIEEVEKMMAAWTTK